MTGVDPTGADPAEHHEELIEDTEEPVIAAEALEAQQVEHEEHDEIARLDAAKERAEAEKADEPGDGDGDRTRDLPLGDR